MFTFLLPPDIEELTISYLVNIGGFSYVSSEIFDTSAGPPPLPFIVVNCIDGGDDMVSEYALLSIHTFHNNRTSASTLSRQIHNKMKNMISIPILMSNSSYASIDNIEVREKPHWEDYGSKEIRRYCARYSIATRCNLTS
jgi:hypothetical protein